MRRTLVLGVGNSILSDDTIGLVVTRRLEERFGGLEGADFGYNEEAGFTLLEESLGYERLVIVDSILTGAEPGTIHRMDLADLGRSIHSNSPHGLNLATVLALGRSQGMDVPEEVRIYAIEVVDTLTFGEDLTPELEACLDSVVDEIAVEVFGERDS